MQLASHFNPALGNALEAGKLKRLMLLSVLRLLLAFFVLAMMVFWSKTPNPGRSSAQLLTVISPLYIAASYALAALTFVWMTQFSQINWRGQLFAQLLADVVLIGLLLFSLGTGFGVYAMLYLLPIAGAASLLSWTGALFICAISVISLLLGGVWHATVMQLDVDWFALGVQGAMNFTMTAIMRYTAQRAEANDLAQHKTQLQAQLVQELQEQHLAQDSQAWLVIDDQQRVQILNAAARTLAWQAGAVLDIGDTISSQHPIAAWLTALTPSQQELQSLALGHTVQAQLMWPVHHDSAAFKHTAAHERLLLQASALPHLPGYTALIVERQASRQARDQQQHLAAMGRISASIAHEIRNPLAAISQASELLQESGAHNASDAPLLAIVLNNAHRIERIVNNLLTWSRGVQAKTIVFDPNEQVCAILKDLQASLGFTEAQLQYVCDQTKPLPLVQFDTDHLYQVLSNVLSNAKRYASGQVASIQVRLRPRGRYVAVCISDDGAPIEAHLAAHLFEPFQSDSKQGDTKGTGLGLFLCQEYARANRGSLEWMSGASSKAVENNWVPAPYTKAFVLNMPTAHSEAAVNPRSRFLSPTQTP